MATILGYQLPSERFVVDTEVNNVGIGGVLCKRARSMYQLLQRGLFCGKEDILLLNGSHTELRRVWNISINTSIDKNSTYVLTNSP